MLRLDDLKTPSLVLDRGRLDCNIERMNARIAALGPSLRPHVKTAKSIEVATRIFGGRPGPITVSTLREAEYFAAAGFDDILYAVGIVPSKLERVRELVAAGTRVTLILDDSSVARAVAEAGRNHGCRYPVLVEIDADDHRAGLKPGDGRIASLVGLIDATEGIAFAGFMTHAGASYECRSAEALRQHAVLERDAVLAAARAATDAGVPPGILSVGSTPTATFAEDLRGITEVRAGVYVFQDLFQAGLGVCEVDDIALSVLASVIGHKPSRNELIIDAGALALSKDRSTAALPVDLGYGQVCEARDATPVPGLTVTGANQEHGLVTSSEGPIDFAHFPIGSRLRIFPNHACMTAAAYDYYEVVDGGDEVVDRWARCNGW